jgi:hypothetical protein
LISLTLLNSFYIHHSREFSTPYPIPVNKLTPLQLNNRVSTNLITYVVPAALTSGLPQTPLSSPFNAIASSDPTAYATVPGIALTILQAVAAALQMAYNKAFQVISRIAFGCCASIAAVMLDTDKFEEKMTTDIALKLQGLEKKRAFETES